MFADASTSIFPDFWPDRWVWLDFQCVRPEGREFDPDSAYWDCEIRARLPGFRSESISLAGRRVLDNPDVGVIVLYPIAKIPGLTASATSSQAPKDSRKAFEKGLNAVKKNKPDEAEMEFRKAVQIYPKHAEAWLELGKVLEQKEHYPEAREAYAGAWRRIRNIVYPYQQLYQMALREQNWKDLAEKPISCCAWTPSSFPPPIISNALAHLQLRGI